jgi:hypothetical protein
MADDGWSWGTAVALLGVGGNLIWNFVNYRSNQNTRKNAARLSDFNSHVRNPVYEALAGLDGIMDSADDIVRSVASHQDKLKSTEDLGKKFHSGRRVLSRRLNDLDCSSLVEGEDWGECDEGHMDEATAAFDDARRSVDNDELAMRLHTVATSINKLRTELRSKLDEQAKRLMS